MESPGGSATTDGQGKRRYVYPADVRGHFRQRRNLVSALLIVLFLAMPWIRIGGHPALLLDVWHGRFAVMGVQFWAHDAPMFFFIVGIAAFTLAFVTAIWGRLWCGWACPQTVFIDAVFRRIERAIEGDSIVRRRRDEAPPSVDRTVRRMAKWFIFTLVALAISHCFLAYFVGTRALGEMMSHSPAENLGKFIGVLVITGLVLFDFGWFREQFCANLCPYGRFQSVFLDERSLAVTYDSQRGEPRRGQAPVTGDCVDCKRCVQVCPTGIDIRNGLQLECIACTACIDACDIVMAKLKKPARLIRYATATPTAGRANPRAWLFASALAALITLFSWSLERREPVDLTFVRATGEPYQMATFANGPRRVINHFHVDVANQTFAPLSLALSPHVNAPEVRLVSPALPLRLEPGQLRRIEVFIEFPTASLSEGRGRLELAPTTQPAGGSSRALRIREVPLVGPFL